MSTAIEGLVSTRAYPMVDGQWIGLDNISWHQYETIADALPELRGLRLIYLDERMWFVTTSREHDWQGERLSQLVVALARALRIVWEDSGQATYRRRADRAGVEGDKTFYFRENARRMLGSKNIDLETQPPPDLAIEVEISHPADAAVSTWGRLGVPEIWRVDADSDVTTFWSRGADGTYFEIHESGMLPGLTPSDVQAHLVEADKVGASHWFDGLDIWIRDVYLPRQAGGG